MGIASSVWCLDEQVPRFFCDPVVVGLERRLGRIADQVSHRNLDTAVQETVPEPRGVDVVAIVPVARRIVGVTC